MMVGKQILMLLGNYDPSTHRGIARASRELNWHLNVSMLSSFQLPTHWEGDGIICSLNNHKTLVDFVTQSALPCVDLSSWRSDLDIPRISADNERIGQLAAEHFCDYGHQHFGWFCHQQNPVAEVRYQSFKKELKKRSYATPFRFVGKQTQNIKAVIQWLNDLPKPSALLAYNDNDAAWLLNICQSNGYQVPDDFAVIGVDNNPLICDHTPIPLSSINHDHERIGYDGAMLLDRIINGESAPNKIQYIQPTGITLRASSDALAVQDSSVKMALQFMIEHLRNPIGTVDIAEKTGISRRNLEMRFQRELKTSVHKKLTDLRIKKAEHLLCFTDDSIEDIAALTGFCHAPHLCRSFKKEYGLPPKAYRNEFSRLS